MAREKQTEASGSTRRRSERVQKRDEKKSNDNSGEASSSNVAVNGVVDAADAHAKVAATRKIYNELHLKFAQEEENRCSSNKGRQKSKKGDTAEVSKRKVARPDLKATSKMIENKMVLYPEKRIGTLPGIDVSMQFCCRAEMVALGIHHHHQSGIDFITEDSPVAKRKDMKSYKFPLAVSIVLSGQYEDDQDNGEEIVYTGQGGNDSSRKKTQIALQNCIEQKVHVRVIRGHKFKDGVVRKVYTYDGLYEVVCSWPEKGASNHTIFKFRLKRVEGQKPLTTKEVYFAHGRIPKSGAEIKGLVCKDISGGVEKLPIPVTNVVDAPSVAPQDFVYIKDREFGDNISVPTTVSTGCTCKNTCTNSKNCACAQLNGGHFPYVNMNGGRLVEPKAVVFECGLKCRCGPDCVNRTSQKGLKFRLEVFRTPNMGWGVRSWETIPAGAPICEYVGRLRRTDGLSIAANNSYVFDIDCLQTMKGLEGRQSRLGEVSLPSHMQKVIDEATEIVPYCIDAAHTGNIARFINHSCSPNLFIQCVLSDHHDFTLATVMLMAGENITPLEELTYDYYYALDSVHDKDGNVEQMECKCGAGNCRGRLY